MGKIIGIDAGTSSLAVFVRDKEELLYQKELNYDYCMINTFPSGVGNGQDGEFSFADNNYREQNLGLGRWKRSELAGQESGFCGSSWQRGENQVRCPRTFSRPSCPWGRNLNPGGEDG